jgi:hypothetical protein
MTTGDADRPGESGEQRPGAVDDAIWTELVAAFHASPSHQPGAWPDAEDLPRDPDADSDADANAAPDGSPGAETDTALGPGHPRTPASPDAASAGPARVVRPANRPGAAPTGPPASVTWTGDAGRGPTVGPPAQGTGAVGPRDWQTPDGAEEEGFVPPTPPPLPELGMATKAAWLVGLGGPVYLAIATVLHWQTPQWASLFCILSGIAGFAYLVTKLKDRPDDDDDDPDDPTFGAVV